MSGRTIRVGSDSITSTRRRLVVGFQHVRVMRIDGENQCSNLTAESCVYRECLCDMHSWARAAHKWRVSFPGGVTVLHCELLYPYYFTLSRTLKHWVYHSLHRRLLCSSFHTTHNTKRLNPGKNRAVRNVPLIPMRRSHGPFLSGAGR